MSGTLTVSHRPNTNLIRPSRRHSAALTSGFISFTGLGTSQHTDSSHAYWCNHACSVNEQLSCAQYAPLQCGDCGTYCRFGIFSSCCRAVVTVASDPTADPDADADGTTSRKLVVTNNTCDPPMDGLKISDLYERTGNATITRQIVEGWCTSNTPDFSWTFNELSVFSANLTAWATSSVTSVSFMFFGASNASITASAWDTSSVYRHERNVLGCE